jgi:hypothetical protein
MRLEVGTLKRILFALTAMAMISSAATFNVLWYTGGVEATGAGTYEAQVNSLAAAAPGATGNTWNVTFWTGGAKPVGSFNVLVVASPQGGWSTNPDYTALNTSSYAGSFDPTAQREFISGQDADWHYTFGPGHVLNGPEGFLLNGVDWAASGTGTGLVTLGDTGEGALLTDAAGKAAFSYLGGSTEDVRIPAAEAGFPINAGLTSAGLSNWGTSDHDQYGILNSSIWNGINTAGASTTQFVTIVSANSSGGGTGGVPEPASIVLFGTVALGVALKLRKRFV